MPLTSGVKHVSLRYISVQSAKMAIVDREGVPLSTCSVELLSCDLLFYGVFSSENNNLNQ